MRLKYLDSKGHRFLGVRRFVAMAIFIFVSGRFLSPSFADSVAQVQTAKRIAASTVALIDPESGTSIGGSITDVNYAVGDILTFTMQFTPVPNGAVRGLGGYLTEYVPGNTEVVGARIIDRNGNTVKPHRGGLTAAGWGSRGRHNEYDALGLAQGSLSQLYADTGIFFSQDLRTERFPSNQLLTVLNGVNMLPAPTGAKGLAVYLGVATGGPFYAHNQWDWMQAMAFGTKPLGGNPIGGNINLNGKGNTPHGYGSAVAGPQTHYTMEATQTSPTSIVVNGSQGPWQRIAYPGSETGTGIAVSVEGAATRAGIPTTAGRDLSVNNPLPAGTNAVRFAVGELVAGEEYFAEISLRVLNSPLDPLLNMDANCAEVFGGDASAKVVSPISGGKDNTWRYFLPSPACVLLNLLFEVDVDKILARPGELLTYTIHAKNLSTVAQTNVVVTDTFLPAEVSLFSAFPTPVSNAGGVITWPTIPSLAPGAEFIYTVAVTALGGGGGSTLNRGKFISDQLPSGFSTVALTNIGSRALLKLDLLPTPSVVSPGGTIAYSGTIRNVGNGQAAGTEYIVTLPAGLTIVNGTSRINGALVADPAGGPRYSYTAGVVSLPAGGVATLTFDVAVAGAAANGLYTACLETWHDDVNYKGGTPVNDSVCGLGEVAVNAAGRSDTPVVTGPIGSGATCASGTTTEADGSTVNVYVNGILRATTSASAGAFTACGMPALFGGQNVTATVINTGAGELVSIESAPQVVVAIPTCSDGVDNDADGFIDFPADPGCASPSDGSEVDPPLAQCSDTLDNDGANGADWPTDLSCQSPFDPLEDGVAACADGVDNDGDGLIDFDGGGFGAPDPDCSGPTDGTELPYQACEDGIDNDADGFIDFPQDPGCFAAADNSEVDDAFTPALIKARLLVLMDTSGSMNFDTCTNNFSDGDGSIDCAGLDVSCANCFSSTCGNGIADDSRLHKVKKGISNAVSGFGEVDWALMRFHQKSQDFACPTRNASLSSGGWQGGGATPCSNFDTGDLVVGFSSENQNLLLDWMDGSTNYSGSPAPRGFDRELRGSGTTPLAGALGTALTYIGATQAADTQSSCRPYQVVLVTDGAETCGGNPAAAAAALRAAGALVNVIGFSTSDPTLIASLDAIAVAGGTTSAILVDNEVALSAAFASIVQGTILVETCNGLDDNCNNLVDEDFTDLGLACSDAGLGICRGTGSMVCSADGLTTVCNITNPGALPGVEVCNLLDDNCNGQIDEGVGACNCVPEICNGLDDDCDNLIDEAPIPGVNDACGTSLGACLPGALQCISGALVCVGGTTPGIEVCNGLDDDCDTFVDEVANECYSFASGCTLGVGCVGTCQTGIQGCLAGANGPCVGQSGPGAELCNGVDDDCNGVIDDGNWMPVGSACDNGQLGLCKASGMYQCSADGSTTVCNAPTITPGIEVCNGIDDDCDTLIDETNSPPPGGLGPPVGTSCGGGGSCTPGTLVCNMGVLECQGAGGGGTEVCNGLDDDCDTLIDEAPLAGLGTMCTDPGFEAIGDTGECSFGATICAAGAIICDGYVGPQVEICNGLDDDCDGVGDQGASCPTAGDLCFEGSCVSACGTSEFPCPFCSYCKAVPGEGDFCVADPCCDKQCPDGQFCSQDTGDCYDPCVGIECGTGLFCSGGVCGNCLQTGFDCPDGEICLTGDSGQGECVPDPCVGVECADGQFCNDGVCDCQSCDPVCGTGEICSSCACIPDPCLDVECKAGQVCRPSDASCVADDLCADRNCGTGTVCHPGTGECIADPCVLVSCPEALVCVVTLDGLAGCVAPEIEGSYIAPGGGGGCGCSAGGGISQQAGLLFMLGLWWLLAGWRRKRRAATGGGRGEAI